LNDYRNDNFAPYLYVSNDFGTTWQTIGMNLPHEPINVVREDLKNANIIYVGTDNGLYISFDKGQTFMNANGNGMPSTGLPAVSVNDLQIHPRENELIVGTHGRSIYIADLKPIQAWTNEVLAKDLYITDLPTINYSSNWGSVRNKYIEPVERKYDIVYYAKTAGKVKITIQTSKDLIVKTITDDAEAGLNYVNFDQAIDASAKVDFEKYLNDTKKKEEKEVKLEVADDKKIYFRPGKYKVIIEQNGAKAEKELEIKASERRNRRGGGQPSPDEHEEKESDEK
jgi:hypothetical protein